MKSATIVGLTLLSIATAAAQGGGQGQAREQTRGQSAQSAEAAIKQVGDDYVKASLAGDPKAIAALYTEDAVEMPPNQPMVKGKAAIQQYYEKLMSGGTRMTNLTLTHLSTHAMGDNGYDVGTYQQNMAQPGTASPGAETGKYVIIMKRTGGAWKVAYAIYNNDQAPSPGR